MLILHILGWPEATFDTLPLFCYRKMKEAGVVFLSAELAVQWASLHIEGVEVFPLACLTAKQQSGEELKQTVAAVETAIKQRDGNGILIWPDHVLMGGYVLKTLERELQGVCSVKGLGSASEPSLAGLAGIMAELRAPWGCPWDREQTHDSLKKSLIEEAYEVLEAIEKKDMHNLCEELGDLLLQIAFHAQIAEEKKFFRLGQVVSGIESKLIRRHPHVFAAGKAETSAEVILSWEAIKRQEKEDLPEKAFFRIPPGLPALMEAEKTQRKAAEIGFDWDDGDGPWRKLQEEIAELEEAVQKQDHIKDELGDLLFSVVNISRFLQVDCEDALRQSTAKFQRRFEEMLAKMARQGVQPENLSLYQLDAYWDEVKKEEKYAE